MIKLTRTQSGMSILTLKAFGLYANVSCGKSGKAKRLTNAQVETLSTRDERNTAMKLADRAAARAGDGTLSYANSNATFPVYQSAFKVELRRMVEARLAAPAKRQRTARTADWFGLAACSVLMMAAAASFNPHVELHATTFAGEVYVVGSGDTCMDAFKGAVYPDDWRELACVNVVL